jgi:hypothetical protein
MLFSDDLPQQVIQSTGSFTGYRPQLQPLGHGYFSATKDFKHPLCGNEEGWGPMSPFRYDFTPCFIDVWVSSVAVFGVVCGAFALWLLLRKSKAVDLAKDWHIWTKQVSPYKTLLGHSNELGDKLIFIFMSTRRFSFLLSPISLSSSQSRSSTFPTFGMATSGYGPRS